MRSRKSCGQRNSGRNRRPSPGKRERTWHLIRSGLEQCQDVDEAVRFLQQRKVRGCGICVVEKGFGWFGMREAVDGAAYTGNLFPAGLLSDKAYDYDMQQFFDDEDPIRQSKFSRFRCMTEVAERNAGNYTLECSAEHAAQSQGHRF